MDVSTIRDIAVEAIAARSSKLDDRLFDNNVTLRLKSELSQQEMTEVVNVLRHGSVSERELAAQLLIEGPISSQLVIATVGEMYPEEGASTVVDLLATALGFTRTTAALPLLRQFVSHSSSDVRFVVSTSLSMCSGGEFNTVAEPLLALSHDSVPEVRWSAVFELCSWFQEAGGDARIDSRLSVLQLNDDECLHILGPLDLPPS